MRNILQSIEQNAKPGIRSEGRGGCRLDWLLALAEVESLMNEWTWPQNSATQNEPGDHVDGFPRRAEIVQGNESKVHAYLGENNKNTNLDTRFHSKGVIFRFLVRMDADRRSSPLFFFSWLFFMLLLRTDVPSSPPRSPSSNLKDGLGIPQACGDGEKTWLLALAEVESLMNEWTWPQNSATQNEPGDHVDGFPRRAEIVQGNESKVHAYLGENNKNTNLDTRFHSKGVIFRFLVRMDADRRSSPLFFFSWFFFMLLLRTDVPSSPPRSPSSNVRKALPRNPTKKPEPLPLHAPSSFLIQSIRNPFTYLSCDLLTIERTTT
ncbi:hypothetical protein VNO77_23334 [Canavalia gladiata]|uniref:Uncharacterized protein n=1 Tax=Canavalia gladiata TaxID=3824 RepID=A0AAN9L7M8_CANGL